MTTRDVINSYLPSSGAGAITAAVMRNLLSMIVQFDSVTLLQQATLDSGISFVVTLGIGDKQGFSFWKPATTQGPMFNNIQSADGKYWERVTGQLPVLNVGQYGIHGDGVTWNQVDDGSSGPWWDFSATITRRNRGGSFPATIDSGGTTVIHWPKHDMRRNDCFCFIPGGMTLPTGLTLLKPYFVLDLGQGTPGQYFTRDSFAFSADNAWQVGGLLPSPPNVPVSTTGGASGIFGPVTFSGSDVQWSGHNIIANTPVCFTSDAALPQILIPPNQPCKLQLFYALSTGLVAGTSFKISSTPGGSPITFTDGGSGNATGYSNPVFITPLNREWVKSVIPPGYYRMPHESAAQSGSGSQRKMVMESYGAIFDSTGVGNTDGSSVIMQNPKAWGFINSVQNGATTLQLKDPTRYNRFYVGQWIFIGGLDLQNHYQAPPTSQGPDSWPINLQVFQYVKITSVNSSGAIGISEPTAYTYSAKWPLIYPGMSDDSIPGSGPACIYGMGPGWDCDIVSFGMRSLEPWGPQSSNGRTMHIFDVRMEGQGVQPGSSRRTVFERGQVCGYNTGIEVDKLSEHDEYTHIEGDKISLNIASACNNILSIQGSKFYTVGGTVKRTIVKDSKLGTMVFGPTFGMSDNCLLFGNEIRYIDTVNRFDDAGMVNPIVNMIERFTYNNGTFSIPFTAMGPINQWCVPGNKCFVTDMAGAFQNMGMPFVIGNVYNDGSGNFCFETTLSSKPVGNTTKATVTFSGTNVQWANHNLPVNTPVFFLTTGTLPSGFNQSFPLYVLSAGLTTGTFQVATSKGGSPVTFTGGSGTHTGVSNALKFRPHPTSRLTALANTGGRGISDMCGSLIEEPLFSRGRRQIFGWSDGNTGQYTDGIQLWGNVDTFLINVIRPATYVGSSGLRLNMSANAFDSLLIQNNFTATIDLTQPGLRTITRTTTSTPIGADSLPFPGFANWLSDYIGIWQIGASGGGQGGPLNATPIVDVFLKTDQGITKLNCWQWLGTVDDHSKIIADGACYGYAS
jgi:hypothetical protein